MRQRIAQIDLVSALRMSAVLGLAVWLLPSLLLAAVVLAALRRLQALFAQLSTVVVAIPAQQIGPLTIELPPLQLDLVERLGLAATSQSVARLTDNPWLMTLALTLGLMLLGTLLVLAAVAVAVLAYNLLAPRVGGIYVQMMNDE